MNEIVFVSGYEDRREQDQQVEGGGHLVGLLYCVRPLMVSKDPQIVFFLFKFWLLYPDST